MKLVIKIIFGSVLLGFIFAALVFLAVWYFQKDPAMGGDFQLNYKGQNWVFSKNAKAINILYVGYAQCPAICPMALSFTSQALKQLSPKESALVLPIFISVDTEHDTPENVARFAEQFYPDFIGLTGTKFAIDNTIQLFGANYIIEDQPDAYLKYSITHTNRIFILNQKGFIVDSVPNPNSANEILIKIKEHL